MTFAVFDVSFAARRS